jgi:hypothetical protein
MIYSDSQQVLYNYVFRRFNLYNFFSFIPQTSQFGIGLHHNFLKSFEGKSWVRIRNNLGFGSDSGSGEIILNAQKCSQGLELIMCGSVPIFLSLFLGLLSSAHTFSATLDSEQCISICISKIRVCFSHCLVGL